MPIFKIVKAGNGLVTADQVDTGERTRNASQRSLDELQAAQAAKAAKPAVLTPAAAKAKAARAQRRGDVNDVIADNDPELAEFLAKEKEIEARIAAQQAGTVTSAEDAALEDDSELIDTDDSAEDAELKAEDEAALAAAREAAEAEAARLAAEEAAKGEEEQTKSPLDPDDAPTFPCDRCDFVAGTQGGLTRHVNAKHAEA